MAHKIFVDTNVFLDAYLERTENWKDSEAILQLAAAEQITLFTSAINIVNIIYVLEKQKLNSSEIIDIIDLTLTYSQLVSTSNAAFRQALRAGFTDLEDAVQYYTALEVKGIDYFITSDIKDYKKSYSSITCCYTTAISIKKTTYKFPKDLKLFLSRSL